MAALPETQLASKLRRSLRRLAPLCWSVVFSGSQAGCQSCDSASSESAEVAPLELPLLDPVTRDRGPGRCVPSGRPTQVLRAHAAGSSNQPVSVDVLSALFVGDAFAVLAERVAGETRAFIALGERDLALREIPLDRLYGASAPPVFANNDAHMVVALADAEATSERLQLLGIAQAKPKAQLVRGPTVSVGRDDSPIMSISVARESGWLVWDAIERGSVVSRVQGLPFQPDTLAELGPVQVLSDPGHDAEMPRVIRHDNEYFLGYLRLSATDDADEDDALVVEPERTLWVKRLESNGPGTNPALPVSRPGEHVLAFDLVALEDSVLLAYRASPMGSSAEDGPIDLVRVQPDGSMIRGRVEHELLGPGAPELFAGQSHRPWLIARGTDSELLLAVVANPSDVHLEMEPILSEHIPLARSGSTLLAMEPRGLDWTLATFECAADQPSAPVE